MTSDKTKRALVVIDIQNDYFPSFDGSKMPLPDMETATENAARLIDHARAQNVPIFHIRHIATSTAAPFFHPNTEGSETHPDVKPANDETIILKNRPNSFQNTDLDAKLKAANVDDLVLCGAMSQMCVDATARHAVDAGYSVTIAHDACAAANVEYDGVSVPAAQVHAAIMAPLAAAYATVTTTQGVLDVA
ncbi:MAG: cysteine hydrolase family protein [Pseudomonadota bacterium]